MRWKKPKMAGGAIIIALLLVGCTELVVETDAGGGMDSGNPGVDAGEPVETDSGLDSGPLIMVDGGRDGGPPPDTGTTGCTTGIFGTSTFGDACFGE